MVIAIVVCGLIHVDKLTWNPAFLETETQGSSWHWNHNGFVHGHWLCHNSQTRDRPRVGASSVTGVSVIGDLPDRARVGFVQVPKLDPCCQLFHVIYTFSTHTMLKRTLLLNNLEARNLMEKEPKLPMCDLYMGCQNGLLQHVCTTIKMMTKIERKRTTVEHQSHFTRFFKTHSYKYTEAWFQHRSAFPLHFPFLGSTLGLFPLIIFFCNSVVAS